MKVSIANRQKRTRLPLRRVERDSKKALTVLGLESAELSLVFVSPVAMKKLNNNYRNIDSTTDVLSFPIHEFRGRPSLFKKESLNAAEAGHDLILGDIVIDPLRAATQAEEAAHSLEDEITRLVVHGLLHLLGYDHEKSAYERRKMLQAEKNLLKHLCVKYL